MAFCQLSQIDQRASQASLIFCLRAKLTSKAICLYVNQVALSDSIAIAAALLNSNLGLQTVTHTY